MVMHHGFSDDGAKSLRLDLLRIASMVAPNSRVLDVGCGDGALLRLLSEERGVDARGIELSQKGVNQCVAKGLSVIQGDADADLADYPADAFDYVILSQTIQATRHPRRVLEHMLRIGQNAIVSFPNFGALAHPHPAHVSWAHADHRKSRSLVVRDAEHSLLHDPRFRAARE